MASNAPHDKTGLTCKVEGCGKVFDKASMTLSIRRKVIIGGSNFIERVRCCGDCYNAHYGGGE